MPVSAAQPENKKSSPQGCPYAGLSAELEEADTDGGSSFVYMLVVLLKAKKLMLAITFGTALVTAIVVSLLPNVYTATATVLPPQQNQSSAMAMLGQLGGALASTGASQLGLKNPADIYVAMLHSRSIAEAMVSRFDLRSVYHSKTSEGARRRLADNSKIALAREGTISISVTDRDPKRSAALANGYVDELRKMTQRIALSEAGQRRLFFEERVAAEKEELSKAEVALQKTQERTGLIQLDLQGKAMIEAVANLRAEIATREVELNTMRSFSTENNPDFIRLRQELVALRDQLAKLEGGHQPGAGDAQLPTGKVPEAAVEYVRSLRDLKYHETLFELLSKQLEAARIDEGRGPAVVQVVDNAIEPEFKSGPSRTQTVVIMTLLALLVSMLLALVRDQIKGNPQVRAKFEELRAGLAF